MVMSRAQEKDLILSLEKFKKIKDKSEMNLPVPELKNDDNIKESSCPLSSFSLDPYSHDIDFN